MSRHWKADPLEHTPPVRGSGDFLKDRGYPNPVETRIKFGLANAIREIVAANNLRQVDVVAAVDAYDSDAGISQPDVSRILRGNVKGYSETRLMTVLAALGRDVSIVVQPAHSRRGRISVRETEAV